MKSAKMQALKKLMGDARQARLGDELAEEESVAPAFMISIGLGPSPELVEELEAEGEDEEEEE